MGNCVMAGMGGVGGVVDRDAVSLTASRLTTGK
jgi:hypothetical protein